MKLKTFLFFSLAIVNQAFSAEMTLVEYLAQVKQLNPGLKAYELRARALNAKIDPAGTCKLGLKKDIAEYRANSAESGR